MTTGVAAPPRPSLGHRGRSVLAWVAVGFGVISLLAAFAQPTVREALFMALFGLAFVLPGAWWQWCARADRRIAARNLETAQGNALLKSYLTPADAIYAQALDAAPVEPPVRRHWKVVAPAAIACAIVGVTIAPKAAEPAPLATPRPAATTAPSAAPVPVAAPVVSSPVAAPAAPTAQAQAPVPAAGPVAEPIQEPVRQDEPAPVVEEQAAEPAVEEQEEPSSGGAAYYSSCKAARAAGAAPIMKGDPGYRSALDRDGDGVACDS